LTAALSRTEDCFPPFRCCRYKRECLQTYRTSPRRSRRAAPSSTTRSPVDRPARSNSSEVGPEFRNGQRRIDRFPDLRSSSLDCETRGSSQEIANDTGVDVRSLSGAFGSRSSPRSRCVNFPSSDPNPNTKHHTHRNQKNAKANATDRRVVRANRVSPRRASRHSEIRMTEGRISG